MADSTAERVRRSRAHKSGDHTLCKSERCPNAGVRIELPKEPRDTSAAERARRYRRHRNGDHSICLPGRCEALSEARDDTLQGNVTPETRATLASLDLGSRGQRLWLEMTSSWQPSPIHREQLLELCRMADRLEKLDRQLKGEDWLRFWSRNDDDTEITVYVDKVLSEARELANAFRALGGDLVKAAGQKAPDMNEGGGVLASLAAKRAARGNKSAG